jgi:hypothetical protein
MDDRESSQSLIYKVQLIECILTIRTYQVSEIHVLDIPKASVHASTHPL